MTTQTSNIIESLKLKSRPCPISIETLIRVEFRMDLRSNWLKYIELTLFNKQYRTFTFFSTYTTMHEFKLSQF